MMKKVFYTILLLAGLSAAFAACSGTYNANPSSNANGVVNPLTPLTAAQFTWGVGSTVGSMGGVINGVAWTTNNVSYGFDTGINSVIGVLGSQIMTLQCLHGYAGNIYPIAYGDTKHNTLTWSDSVGGSYYQFYSYYGNSGEIYVTENDSAFFKGMFYCEVLTPGGQITAINNGYFNIAKP